MNLAEPSPGFLSTEWALLIELIIVLFMILAAVACRSARELISLESNYGWASGVLLMTSSFFVHAHGAFGVTYSPYTSLTWYWGFPKIVYALPMIWPQVLGTFVALTAFSASVNRNETVKKVQWMAISSFLVVVGVVLCGVLVHSYLQSSLQMRPSLIGVVIVVTQLIAAISAAVFCMTSRKSNNWKLSLILLVGSTSMLYSVITPFVPALRGGSLRGCREGYWLASLGVLLLTVGSLRGIVKYNLFSDKECSHCGYDLRDNVSGICPECGTVIPEEQRARLRLAAARGAARPNDTTGDAPPRAG